MKALLFLSCTCACWGQLVVDTGPARSVQSGSALYHDSWGNFQNLAGRFEIVQATQLTAIQGWMGSSIWDSTSWIGRGTITVNQSLGALPGAIIYSSQFEITQKTYPTWQGIAELNWNLDAGSFWVTFSRELDNGGMSYMPNGADLPLSAYAYANGGNADEWYSGGALGLGVRIYGQNASVAVPEPANFGLLAVVGCVFIVGFRLVRRCSGKDT